MPCHVVAFHAMRRMGMTREVRACNVIWCLVMGSHVIMYHEVSCRRSSCIVMKWDSMACPNLSCHDVNMHSVSCRFILHDVTTSLVMSGDTTRLNVVFHDIIHCITDQNVSTDVAPIPDMSHHAGLPLVMWGRWCWSLGDVLSGNSAPVRRTWHCKVVKNLTNLHVEFAEVSQSQKNKCIWQENMPSISFVRSVDVLEKHLIDIFVYLYVFCDNNCVRPTDLILLPCATDLVWPTTTPRTTRTNSTPFLLGEKTTKHNAWEINVDYTRPGKRPWDNDAKHSTQCAALRTTFFHPCSNALNNQATSEFENHRRASDPRTSKQRALPHLVRCELPRKTQLRWRASAEQREAQVRPRLHEKMHSTSSSSTYCFAATIVQMDQRRPPVRAPLVSMSYNACARHGLLLQRIYVHARLHFAWCRTNTWDKRCLGKYLCAASLVLLGHILSRRMAGPTPASGLLWQATLRTVFPHPLGSISDLASLAGDWKSGTRSWHRSDATPIVYTVYAIWNMRLICAGRLASPLEVLVEVVSFSYTTYPGGTIDLRPRSRRNRS